MNQKLQKFLYGALFVLFLPVLLLWWTVKTEASVALPAIHSVPAGVGVALTGLSLMVSGMLALWTIGGGLPMNAFPPPRYVNRGIYRLLSHPIYVGFTLVWAGAAMAGGSASGLWLTTPAVALASAALVLGYERDDMRRRFGDAMPRSRFPFSGTSESSHLLDCLRCFLIVFLPWLVFYEAVIYLGPPRDAVIAYLPFERHLPVLPWAEVFYFSVYPVVVLVPFLGPDRAALRLFCVRAWLSMVVSFPVFLCIPLISPPRPFIANSMWGAFLTFDRRLDGPSAAFPSYHVIWAFLAAEALGAGNRWRKLCWRTWAALASASCVATGMHALVDVLAGLFVVLVLLHFEAVWACLRAAAESIANSWREWRIGPARIINHGAYAGLGVFVGICLLQACLTSNRRLIPVSTFVGGAVGAALWAQAIEGSPGLLRPLGFYGGLLGTCLFAVVAALWSNANPWLVLAALCVAVPWVQGIGRLRCLVQGCCHGRPSDAETGILYRCRQSRVWRVPELRNAFLHATPLYSLLWNVVVAMAVTRLYLLQARAAMIGGIYLILSALGRFVEEAYRGEPQTPIFWGLRLYQWIAAVTLIAGAIVTSIPGTPIPPRPSLDGISFLVPMICALAAWFVTSIDFPESNRRFARLT